MKRILFVVMLMAFATTLFAQPSPGQYIKALTVKTYHPFAAASDDTTGYITVPIVDVLNASEVAITWVSDDSVQAAVYVIGSNSALSSKAQAVVYTDSISTILSAINGAAGFATVQYRKSIPIKGHGYDRLPGCNRFKIGTVFTAATGTRAANTGKWYLTWRP
jgi:hypothetical protein